MALNDSTTPPAWEAHPLYVVLAPGVGTFPVGSVVLAGDLGSAADIQAMEQAGQIAARHTADAQDALQQTAAAPAAAGETPTQQGVPYVDPSGGDVSTSASRTTARAGSADTGSSATTDTSSKTPTSGS